MNTFTADGLNALLHEAEKIMEGFVSSTWTDMILERQAAVEAILEAGHIPAGMELFSADNKKQFEVIKKWIRDSDVFILILGGRYGSRENGKVNLD